MTFALWALSAFASLGSEPGPCHRFSTDECLVGDFATGLDLKLRNSEGQQVLNGILSDASYWSGADVSTFSDKNYDEIRLKQLGSGYVPMITGEGDQDFPHEVVAHVVFKRNTDLPKYMSGAKAIVFLGAGHDSVVGADYRDTFYILDLTVMYAYFPQRMYTKHDDAANRTVLWFEKMDPSFVDASTWSTYQTKMTAALDAMDKRWPPFNSTVPVDTVYGMFVVEPGKTRESRVSFVSKIGFAPDAGWMANFGSQLPMVIKSGLKSGFNASVAIAQHEKEKRIVREGRQPAAGN
jgi:hypothetical protein